MTDDNPEGLSPMPNRWFGAVSGAVSAGVALGVSYLIAGVLELTKSPVVVVGDSAITAFPPAVERFAIDTFGRNDKRVLIVGIVLFSFVFGALLGVLARRSLAWAAAGFAAFAVFPVLLSIGDFKSSVGGIAISVSVGAVIGILTLRYLLDVAPVAAGARCRWRCWCWWRSTRRGFGRQLGSSSLCSPRPVRSRYRRGGGGVGPMALRGYRHCNRQNRELASKATPCDPKTADRGRFGREGTHSLRHARRHLLQDRHGVDRTPCQCQRLALAGDRNGQRPLALSFNELLDFGLTEHWTTLTCVSNEVGGDLVGNAFWGGVLLKDVLDAAGVEPGATQVVGRSVDGWTSGFPTEAALDGRPP